MQKIISHLWFDKEAKEASEFYVSIFANSELKSLVKLTETPSGDCDLVNFRVSGLNVMAISAGSNFKFNPSVSFYVTFENGSEIEVVWKKLVDGGNVLMPYNSYPWANKYGWLQDKYGLSWQVVPTVMGEMMKSGDKSKMACVTQAFLKMKKFDIKKLNSAFEG